MHVSEPIIGPRESQFEHNPTNPCRGTTNRPRSLVLIPERKFFVDPLTCVFKVQSSLGRWLHFVQRKRMSSNTLTKWHATPHFRCALTARK
ncbi:hypothetical protein AVEN_127512-1 [Araneus ventricosus]|uniref:Uncharacterized protein n=1 Tax=Araneus ventricosus TaxID=182803 RepID=A0A4Y2E1E0_ARAVE|nr:hypothetical protein AVEN_127512-1 [Araneus ventricosus]